MKFNGILTLVVTVLAVVLISSACIIPVVQSTQEKQYSTDNNTSQYFTCLNTTDDVTLTWSPVNDNGEVHLLINGVEQNTVSVSASSQGVTKIWADGYSCLTIFSTSANSGLFRFYSGANTQYDGVKLVYESGTVSIYSANDTMLVSVTSSYLLYPSDNGNYGSWDPRQPANRQFSWNVDDVIYMGNAGGSQTNSFLFSGKVGNIQLQEHYWLASWDEVSATIPVVLSDDGLSYKLASTPYVTYTDSTEQTPSTTNNWTVFYAPIEYKYLSDSDSVIIAMLSIIPVLILLVPIMLVVRSFVAGRD